MTSLHQEFFKEIAISWFAVCICVCVYTSLTPENINSSILVPSGFQKYNTCIPSVRIFLCLIKIYYRMGPYALSEPEPLRAEGWQCMCTVHWAQRTLHCAAVDVYIIKLIFWAGCEQSTHLEAHFIFITPLLRVQRKPNKVKGRLPKSHWRKKNDKKKLRGLWRFFVNKYTTSF